MCRIEPQLKVMASSGETNLAVILKNISPVLNKGQYVFCTASEVPAGTESIGSFREKEGGSFILEKSHADRHRFSYSSVMSWITLDIHTSIDGVGFTAAFSKALGDNNISCNVVAAFYHDHIFVPEKDAEKAIRVLKNLSGQ